MVNPVFFDDKIKPICLPNGDYVSSLFEEQTIVTGWVNLFELYIEKTMYNS